jgi:hypothetical protein
MRGIEGWVISVIRGKSEERREKREERREKREERSEWIRIDK